MLTDLRELETHILEGYPCELTLVGFGGEQVQHAHSVPYSVFLFVMHCDYNLFVAEGMDGVFGGFG